jgi:anti-anti-sigma regulatory factor
MTLAIHAVQPGPTPRYGNPADFYGAAEVSVQSRHLATLLTICGDVDDANADPLYDRGGRFVLPDTGFVLDLSGVTSFAAAGLRLVARIDEACRDAGIEWALVASRAVAERLSVDSVYPLATSVREALNRFSVRR